MVEPDVDKFQTSIQDEVIPTSIHRHKKLSRAYYEINCVPSIIMQLLLGRAEVQILSFEIQ